jgi:hypothetical protein
MATQTKASPLDGSLAMLEQSLAGADNSMQATQQQSAFNLDSLIGDVQNQIAQGAQVRESKSATATRKIIESTFQTAREDAAKIGQDLFELIGNLDVFVKGFGIELSQLEKPTQDQINRLKMAEAAIAKAGTKWFGREKAVAKAQADLEQLKIRITAEVRERLMKTSTEQTLATFQLLVNKISGRLETRIQEIDQTKKAVTSRKAVAIEIKRRAAEALDNLRQKKDETEAQYISAQDILSSMENGKADYVAQAKVVSDLKEQLDTIEGNLNVALALFQDKEIFVQRLEEHELVQTKLLSNHKTWLTLLKSQTEERVTTWRSTLSALQSASDQEISKTLNDTGREIDNKTDEMMGQVLVASERAIIETFEGFPDHLRNLVNICGATTQMEKEFASRQQKMYADLAQHYGIDQSQLNRFGSIDKVAA